MKAKNFLFTAVLTFGAILFATNVNAQSASVTKGEGTATAGKTVGTVDLVLKLKDFQELKVNGGSSTVQFSFESSADFTSDKSVSAYANAQLNVFSTKKFNIEVSASEFTTTGGTNKTLTGGTALFSVQATKVNNVEVVGSKSVVLTQTAQNLFDSAKSQSRTKLAEGYNVDINYTLSNPSALIDLMEAIATPADFGNQNEFTSTVTYTIIPG